MSEHDIYRPTITNVIEDFVRESYTRFSEENMKPAIRIDPALSPVKADTLSPACSMDCSDEQPNPFRSQSSVSSGGGQEQVQYRPFNPLGAAEYYELEMQQIVEEARQKREQEEKKQKQDREAAYARWAKQDSIRLHFGRGALPFEMKQHSRNGLVKVVLGGKPGGFTKISSGW